MCARASEREFASLGGCSSLCHAYRHREAVQCMYVLCIRVCMCQRGQRAFKFFLSLFLVILAICVRRNLASERSARLFVAALTRERRKRANDASRAHARLIVIIFFCVTRLFYYWSMISLARTVILLIIELERALCGRISSWDFE